MNLYNIGKINKPIVYMAITFCFSSIVYCYSEYSWLTILLTSLFFIFIYLKTNREFFILIFIIFLIGIGFNINYYNLKIGICEEIKIEKIYSYGGIGEIKGRNFYIEGDLNKFSVGDNVLCKCKFQKDLDKERGILGKVKIEEVKLNENNLLTVLNRYKLQVKNKLIENVGQRKSAFITSIVFGKDEELDYEDEEMMKGFGIVHVMSVSGLHIALIFTVFRKIVKDNMALILSLVYVVFTGMEFSSIRAFIMILLINIGLRVKKKNNSIASLALSSIIIFMWKPYCIVNVGFLLSYGATLGILLYYNNIRRILYKIPSSICDVISISLSSQVFTFPILIYIFNEFSIGFIIGNILLVPVINIVLVLGVLLLFLIKFNFLFDFISYLLLVCVNIFDSITKFLDNLIPDVLILNEYYGYFYISLMITFYLYRRGIKKIIVLPISYIVFIAISLYSFYPKIYYRNEGALLLSYKGERILLESDIKDNSIETIKQKTSAIKSYRDYGNIYIDNNISLIRNGKDFILNSCGHEYYLKMSNHKKEIEYDIINFKKKEAREIIIIKDKVIILR